MVPAQPGLLTDTGSRQGSSRSSSRRRRYGGRAARNSRYRGEGPLFLYSQHRDEKVQMKGAKTSEADRILMSSHLCLEETFLNSATSAEACAQLPWSDDGVRSWRQNVAASNCVSAQRREHAAVRRLTTRRCRAPRWPSTCFGSSFSLLPVTRISPWVSLLSSGASSGWSWDHSSWREVC